MHLVISPHMDDAVFSCGRWLARRPGCTVITLFAGVPRDASQQTDWDRRCGYASAGEAVAARRRDDAAGLALVGARPRWLDFADGQYGESPDVGPVRGALRERLLDLQPDVVLLPLGLSHPDHRLAHEAGVAALRALSVGTVLTYEDMPYRSEPRVLQQRLVELAEAGVRATPAHPGTVDNGRDAARKARAVRAYASQLRGFGPDGAPDLALPERLWRLDLPPDAENGP